MQYFIFFIVKDLAFITFKEIFVITIMFIAICSLITGFLSMFILLSYHLYPIFSLLDILFISIPVGNAVSGLTFYIISCLTKRVNEESLYYSIMLMALFSLPYSKQVFDLYYKRTKLWQGNSYL